MLSRAEYRRIYETGFIKELEYFCRLDGKRAEFMKKAFDEMKLSARGYARILKVARTIADLEGAEEIELEHLQEIGRAHV